MEQEGRRWWGNSGGGEGGGEREIEGVTHNKSLKVGPSGLPLCSKIDGRSVGSGITRGS